MLWEKMAYAEEGGCHVQFHINELVVVNGWFSLIECVAKSVHNKEMGFT